MEVGGDVFESPASPDEILFIEDRRPGQVSPVFENSKSNGPINEKQETITEDFIKLSSDAEYQHEYKSIQSNEININLHMDTAGTENKNTVQLEDGLCFVIEDRNPQLTGEDTQSPKYKINENYLKHHDSKSSTKRNRFTNPCFNCGETEHIIRDCPQPRDHRKISRNRKEFMDSKSHVPVYRRYHKDGHDSYGQSMPGEISSELREALGLEENELPSYTYMMRLAGYPPGWLQEATVSHSGISMFDGQGKEVQQPGTEQGEGNDTNQDKYDIRKIIHYPGFNVPPPPGAYDDCNYWRCPPFSKRQSVEALVERLANRVVGGYKRKKLSLNATSSMDDSLQSNESHDMEYEETPENKELPEDHCKFIPPLPDQDLPPPPPLESPESPPPIVESPESPDPDPSHIDTASQSLLSTSAEETSLLELVEQKKLLLAQLNDVSPTCGTPDSKIGKTKTIEFGTPILKSVSPFARLPSSDKFSVNICDVINFENLPDSTGKYEQMSGIIKKVRKTLKEYSE